MPKYTVTITAQYEIDIEDLERDREAITEGYTLPEFPDFIPEDAIEFLGGDITYEEAE
jgi:hypothetical protein